MKTKNFILKKKERIPELPGKIYKQRNPVTPQTNRSNQKSKKPKNLPRRQKENRNKEKEH
jgi:hypothetical protein